MEMMLVLIFLVQGQEITGCEYIFLTDFCFH